MESKLATLRGVLGSAEAALCGCTHYSGRLDHSLMQSLADSCQRELEATGLSLRLQRRAFHACVELLNNALQHAAAPVVPSRPYGVQFLMSIDGGEVRLWVGNVVTRAQAVALQQRIDMLNAIPRDCVRSIFLNQLSDGLVTETGNAGLGLIDMVRKADEPLGYSFSPFEGELMYYEVCVAFSEAPPTLQSPCASRAVSE